MLRSDIIIDEEEKGEGRTSRKVGTAKRTFYGLFQELGTKKGNKLPPRPFLQPALESPSVVEAAKKELKRGLGK
jgi:hypothetical protein